MFSYFFLVKVTEGCVHSIETCKWDNTVALSGKIYWDYRFLREELRGCYFTFISTKTLPIQKENTLRSFLHTVENV